MLSCIMKRSHSTMAFVLKLLAVLGVFITVCECLCVTEKQKMPPRGTKLQGCWRDGEVHAFETKWESVDCQDCTCHKSGMICCSHDKVPVGYNPKICIALKENCTNRVVRKKDHSIPCPFKEVELNSDSDSDKTDSSDSSDNKSNNKNSKSDDEDDFSIKDFLDLLSYFEGSDECDKKTNVETEYIADKVDVKENLLY